METFIYILLFPVYVMLGACLVIMWLWVIYFVIVAFSLLIKLVKIAIKILKKKIKL